jgi:hypothetical protein
MGVPAGAAANADDDKKQTKTMAVAFTATRLLEHRRQARIVPKTTLAAKRTVARMAAWKRMSVNASTSAIASRTIDDRLLVFEGRDPSSRRGYSRFTNVTFASPGP